MVARLSTAQPGTHVAVLSLTCFTPATDLERDPVGVGELKAEGQLGQRQHQQQLHGFDSVGTGNGKTQYVVNYPQVIKTQSRRTYL